ncbi:MAG TPA: DegT/DnrJ/EryC1/StrS family aminotransferase [Candidatus Saccharimonadales bacterium]|nr:DegT/DnrJ/EryC1/StrS family aminotransferase [Candidatus Saccharimonadales bacterium]
MSKITSTKNMRIIEYENLYKANKSFFTQYKQSFNKTLNSGWYILGDNVRLFENSFAKYLDAKYCVGVASGLDALEISLKCLDLEPKSEVIVPSNTYIATILAIIKLGLKPVLVEPNPMTYNIDVLKIEQKVTKHTKVIMPVHLYGKSCEMDKIMLVAKKHKLSVIEDCAQSHGAMFNKLKTGTFGDFGAFSFYPTKNLGALGDAGAIVCKTEQMYQKILALRNYGSNKKYFNKYIGYNSRLDEVQAGFLSVKLEHLDQINRHKRQLAAIYQAKLSTDFIKPAVEKAYFDVYHIYAIRHAKRDQLKEYLLKQGIKTEIHYPLPPHKQEAMQGVIKGKYPLSEEIHSTVLSLPISYLHTPADIEHVIAVMNKF